jgi:chemotaxis signal transduction protein
MSSQNMEFGILADVVIGTILISDEEILQVPHTITGIAQKYLSGVTRENLIFLNGEALLTGEGLIIDDK